MHFDPNNIGKLVDMDPTITEDDLNAPPTGPSINMPRLVFGTPRYKAGQYEAIFRKETRCEDPAHTP